MTYLPILLQIAVVYLVAAITPGPNFFMISQLSLAGRRSLGAASALGVGTASVAWATLAMLGLAAVLRQVKWLYDNREYSPMKAHPMNGALWTFATLRRGR